jgi:transglutaminase/protease-like cytokinesis protein 3
VTSWSLSKDSISNFVGSESRSLSRFLNAERCATSGSDTDEFSNSDQNVQNEKAHFLSIQQIELRRDLY